MPNEAEAATFIRTRIFRVPTCFNRSTYNTHYVYIWVAKETRHHPRVSSHGQLGPQIYMAPTLGLSLCQKLVSQSERIHLMVWCVFNLNYCGILSAFLRTKCLITSLLPLQMFSRQENFPIQLELYFVVFPVLMERTSRVARGFAITDCHNPGCNSDVPQMASLSTLSFRARIWPIRSEDSFEVMAAEMTALETPHARPRATLLGT